MNNPPTPPTTSGSTSLPESLHAAYPHAMKVSRLHGFLTGVALSSAAIHQHPWPAISLGLPLQNTPPIPEAIQRQLETYVDLCSTHLLDGALRPSTSFQDVQTDQLDLQDWSQGFLQAHQLTQNDWQTRCQQDAALQGFVHTLMALADPAKSLTLALPNADPNDPTNTSTLSSQLQQQLPTLCDHIPLEED